MKIDFSKLRLSVGANYLKRQVLGPNHVPGSPQSERFLSALHKISGGQFLISQDTWERWIRQALKSTPRQETLKAIDSTLSRLNSKDSNFLEQIVRGGLADGILQAQKSDRYLKHAEKKINQYRPSSPIHTFVDAFEIATNLAINDTQKSASLRNLSASMLLQQIHSKWNLEQGTIYSELSSDLSIQWGDLNDVERAELRSAFSKFKPDVFDSMMDSGVETGLINIKAGHSLATDNITGLLFSLLADPNFLRGDRTIALAWDLPAATMALHTKCFLKPHLYFGKKITSEACYLRAWDAIFLHDIPEIDLLDHVYPAAKLSGFEEAEFILEPIKKVRDAYLKNLSELNISPSLISTLFIRSRQTQSLKPG
jgi:hypothetical protein